MEKIVGGVHLAGYWPVYLSLKPICTRFSSFFQYYFMARKNVIADTYAGFSPGYFFDIVFMISPASKYVRSKWFPFFVAIIKQNFRTYCLIWLTLSWRRPLSYRNQSIDLLCKSVDWFLYDNGLRHEKVKVAWYWISILCLKSQYPGKVIRFTKYWKYMKKFKETFSYVNSSITSVKF